MPIKATYVHTNLTARDWRSLAQFYCDVFGCVPKLPERNLAGQWLARLTALDDPHLTGIHLRLPGIEGEGPTLEIFGFDALVARSQPVVNEPGFGHLAFLVEEVGKALAAVRAAGGGTVGEVVTTDVPGVGRLEAVYARDPEGNIVELQHWA